MKVSRNTAQLAFSLLLRRFFLVTGRRLRWPLAMRPPSPNAACSARISETPQQFLHLTRRLLL